MGSNFLGLLIVQPVSSTFLSMTREYRVKREKTLNGKGTHAFSLLPSLHSLFVPILTTKHFTHPLRSFVKYFF